jgi:hypothetical protein
MRFRTQLTFESHFDRQLAVPVNSLTSGFETKGFRPLLLNGQVGAWRSETARTPFLCKYRGVSLYDFGPINPEKTHIMQTLTDGSKSGNTPTPNGTTRQLGSIDLGPPMPRRKRILCVDDDDDSRAMLVLLLSNPEVEVISATCVEEGLQLIE